MNKLFNIPPAIDRYPQEPSRIDNNINQLGTSQVQALNDVRHLYGKNWKNKLVDCWMTGEYRGLPDVSAHVLQALRNTHGPAWLAKFKQELLDGQNNSKNEIAVRDNFKHGDKIDILPEFQDPGDSEYEWIAIDDEEKGRVTITALIPNMSIKPQYVVNVNQIKHKEPEPKPAPKGSNSQSLDI